MAPENMTHIISYQDLKKEDHTIIDVRTSEEITADPIDCPQENYVHMELSTIPKHHTQLPQDTRLAFVCAGNIRSAQAVEYLRAIGYNNVCVLDKFSI